MTKKITTPSKPLEIIICDAAKNKAGVKWGQVKKGYKFYPCHKAQLDVLRSKARFKAALAGAQGGKTAMVPLQLGKWMDANKGGRYLIASPTHKMLKQSQLVQHIINCFQGTKWEGEYKKGESIYEYPGGEILFRTTDIPENLDGGVYDGVVLDEAAKMSDEAWMRLKVRAGSNNSPILIVTTPDILNWIKPEVFDRWEAGDKDYFVRQWTSLDRPGYSRESYEQAKRTMHPALFARMFEGQFSSLEGLVYECFGDDKSDAYPVIPAVDRLPSPAVRAFGFVDWGWHPDPAAAYLAVHCEDDRIYIVDEIYDQRIETDVLAVRLRDMKDRWSIRADSQYADSIRGGFFDTFYCDVSRPESVAVMRRHGIPFRNKMVTEIMAGVAMTDQMFRGHRICIFDTCVNLIREAKNYAWAERKSVPKAGNDHAMDALRYGISSYMYGRPITPLMPVVVTPDEEAVAVIETAIRLGQVSDDPSERRKQAEKAEEQKQRQWLNFLQNLEAGETY